MRPLFYDKRQRFFYRCQKALHEMNEKRSIQCSSYPDDVIEHLIQCGAFNEQDKLYACVKSARAENSHHFENLLHQAKKDKWSILGVKSSLLISLAALVISILSFLASRGLF